MRLPPHAVSLVRRAVPRTGAWRRREARDRERERERERAMHHTPVVGTHGARVRHWVPAGGLGAVAWGIVFPTFAFATLVGVLVQGALPSPTVGWEGRAWPLGLS